MNRRVHDMEQPFIVAGGGNGGFASAVYLARCGFKVVLYDLPEFQYAVLDVVKLNCINIEARPSSGLTSEIVPIDTVRTMRLHARRRRPSFPGSDTPNVIRTIKEGARQG